MIASLRGRVAAIGASSCVVETTGVGYLVQASTKTLEGLEMGGEVFILVHTQVREDAITLYGFADAAERDVFLLLVSVQGVGPRIALSILGVMLPGRVLDALASEDKASLCAADGVGPKLAARIASELKEKASQAAGRAGVVVLRNRGGDVAVEEARSALRQLGFKPDECGRALSEVLGRPDAPSDTPSLVSACLRSLAPRVA